MNTQTVHIKLFTQTVYSWEVTKDNYPSVLEVSLSKYDFNKPILKAVKKYGISYNDFKEIYDATMRLYSNNKDLSVPNLVDIYENDQDFQDFFTDLGFDLIDEERGTSSTLYFKSETPFTKEEARSIRPEIEYLIYPYIEDWVEENKDKLLDELDTVQGTKVSRASNRQARKANVKDVGIFGYVALDGWGKPLEWGKNKSDVSGERYLLMLNDGTFEVPSMGN